MEESRQEIYAKIINFEPHEVNGLKYLVVTTEITKSKILNIMIFQHNSPIIYDEIIRKTITMIPLSYILTKTHPNR